MHLNVVWLKVLFAALLLVMLATKAKLKNVCMGKRFHLTNTIGPWLGGKVAYAVMLEALGVDRRGGLGIRGYVPFHQG